MSLGDGVTWSESKPDNDTVAHQIDDYDRDLRVGVRSRMAREHIWPAAQTATNEGGHHTFVTFQAQTAAPSMAGTTAGCVWVGTDKALYFTDSAGTDFLVVESAKGLALVTSGTAGSIPICSSAAPSGLTILAASALGYVLTTRTNTANASWQPVLTMSGTGVTGAATALPSGNQGPISTGHEYYYLSMGISTADGQMKLVSGSTGVGVAIPLPAGCPQANCHWIISPKFVTLDTLLAMKGITLGIGSDRVVTMSAIGHNWVS